MIVLFDWEPNSFIELLYTNVKGLRASRRNTMAQRLITRLEPIKGKKTHRTAHHLNQAKFFH